MKRIDWTAPVEYVNGETVSRHHGDFGNHYAGKAQTRTVDGNFYDDYGRHLFGVFPDVRNVADVATLDTSKPLQTVDGKKVSFIGTMTDGRIVVAVDYPRFGGGAPTELRFADGRKSSAPGVTSGDDVIVKVVEKTTFQNVYADGRIGDTIHSDTDAAAKRSKYGKVRIGFLKTVTKDGVRTSVSLQSATIPWYRDASVPLGRAAVPADYAR